ncbi:MAG: hypothetical protein WB902_01640 [Acetobacteraceae bacterium]|jgi:hypothetical protein
MGDITPNQRIELCARFRAGGTAINGRDGYECTSLVEAGLKAAHANSFEDYEQPASEDYVWGREIPDLNDLQPGDILQFRDCTSTVRTDADDGSWRSQALGRDHHSAIVTKILQKGQSVQVLEQNVDPDHRKIFSNTIYLKNSIFHTGKNSVTHVTVDGTIWAYRPQSKSLRAPDLVPRRQP